MKILGLLQFLLMAVAPAVLLAACTSEPTAGSTATRDAGQAYVPALEATALPPNLAVSAEPDAMPVASPTASVATGATPAPAADDPFNSVRDFVAIVEPWQLVHADELDYPGDTENFGFYAEAGQTYLIDIYPRSDPGQPLSPGSHVTLHDFSGLELASFDRLMDWEAPSSGYFYLVAATGQNDDYELLIIPECVIDHTVREGSTKEWAQDSAQEVWRALGPAQVQRLFMDCIDRVETQADFGADLLSLAVQYNENPQVIRALLDAALNTERGSVDEVLLLQTAAAFNGSPEVMELLLDAVVSPETKIIVEVGLLGVVASNANPEVIKVLLGAGADVNAKTSSGHTPLHSAAGSSEDNWEVIQTLLDAGADVNAWTDRGITPLHSASGSDGHPAKIKVLLDAGADVNAWDNRGITPLHVAASTGNLEMVKALLEGGADVDAKTSRRAYLAIGSGATPLHYAAVHPENQAVIWALLDAGADIEAKNSDGETPLDLAMKRGNSPTVQALKHSSAGP